MKGRVRGPCGEEGFGPSGLSLGVWGAWVLSPHQGASRPRPQAIVPAPWSPSVTVTNARAPCPLPLQNMEEEFNERVARRAAVIQTEADARVAEAKASADAANEQAEKMSASLRSLNNAFRAMRADDSQVWVRWHVHGGGSRGGEEVGGVGGVDAAGMPVTACHIIRRGSQEGIRRGCGARGGAATWSPCVAWST
jgi:hypothetical protein